MQGRERTPYKGERTYHSEYNGHHRQSPFTHRGMVIDMRRPCPIQRDQATCVHCSTENVLRLKVPLVPHDHLSSECMCCARSRLLLFTRYLCIGTMQPAIFLLSSVPVPGLNICTTSSAQLEKPIMIGVPCSPMFQPTIDEHICRIVVERGLDELGGAQRGRVKHGIGRSSSWHCRVLYCNCKWWWLRYGDSV